MTPDQLTQAIINAFLQGGEQFLEGTMAAALPLLWMLVVALHLARPYMVRTTRKFSLRLGADIWWVLYIGLRDVMIALTAILSFMFLYPDVIVADSLPIGGSLATVALFGALLVKLLADADNDPRAFKLVSTFLGIGSALYLVPTLLGVQLTSVDWGPFWSNVAAALSTNTNQGVALALCWFSVAAIAVMGLVALVFNLRAPAKSEALRVRQGRIGA
ncbi:MAG TPA: hypothetical protein VFK22_05905 [Candidatus Dormibacteraeota bacterium]|nr:hypothetical protein [Candidatus Dormibacteraeota bacterium]